MTAPSIFWDYEQALKEDIDTKKVFASQKSIDDFKMKFGKKKFLKASSIFVAMYLLDKKPRVKELLEELKEKESFLKRHWGRDKFNHLMLLLESFKASKEFEMPKLDIKGEGFIKKPGLLHA